MCEVALIGIDLGKHVFHLHAQDRGGHELWRKKVTRKQLLLLMSNFPRCTLVMEACAGSHCLARELQALGHEASKRGPSTVCS
ncbi:transposase [Cupriavidus sp. AcVe19-6a]|nr:transposase [Cupriavidus sp. AcVe19-6a]